MKESVRSPTGRMALVPANPNSVSPQKRTGMKFRNDDHDTHDGDLDCGVDVVRPVVDDQASSGEFEAR